MEAVSPNPYTGIIMIFVLFFILYFIYRFINWILKKFK